MILKSLIRRWRVALVALALATTPFGAIALAAPSTTPVPTPTVTRAPDAGTPWSAATLDLAKLGYVQEEYFIEGTARAYVPTVDLKKVTNGQWDSKPTGPTAPYKTRLLVERPRDPAKFNGMVIVEWFNVTAMRDGGMFSSFGEWFTREGYAYVGVSAQQAGPTHLKGYNAQRYGTLAHPGDTYSYDIFSQAAKTLKAGNILPLGDLTSRVKGLIAWGGSQSGWRLITYVNAVHPDARLYDAIVPFVGGWAADLAQAPLPIIAVPTGAGVMIRTDIKTPVLVQVSEGEAMSAALGYHRQPDSAYFRLWEHAGTAHVSQTTAVALGQGARAPAAAPSPAPSAAPGGRAPPAAAGLVCENPPGNGLSAVPIWHAMVKGIDLWVRTGRAPQSAPRTELKMPTDPTQPGTAVRDPATGITKGGIRMPHIAVPVATRWGERPPGMNETRQCRLYGASDMWNGDSDPWDRGPTDISPKPEPSLKALYGTNARYVAAVQKSAEQLVAKGWLLEDDVATIVDEARTVKIE